MSAPHNKLFQVKAKELIDLITDVDVLNSLKLSIDKKIMELNKSNRNISTESMSDDSSKEI